MERRALSIGYINDTKYIGQIEHPLRRVSGTSLGPLGGDEQELYGVDGKRINDLSGPQQLS